MFNYSRDLIRRLDYEGFLILNFVFKKSHKLGAAMAIKAFDAEIASIAHTVMTPEAAAIRYEFWRSALERIKRGKDFEGHPLVEGLYNANLSTTQMYWLEASLKARADSLDRRIYSLADMDEYAHKSLVQILWCINSVAKASEGANTVEIEHALDHLGKAQVTLRRLKGFANALSKNNPLAEQFIPIGLLGKSGLNGPKMIEALREPNNRENNEKLCNLVHEMASHAHSHLSLIKPMNSPFLNLSKYCSLRYLKELEKQNFFILNDKVRRIGSQRDGLLPLKLFFKTLF